jgi:hypothetical protein
MAVEDAHHEAVRSTLAWVEKHAAYTRAGHAGTAQIHATGLVAAAFDHRDSRTSDHDLHPTWRWPTRSAAVRIRGAERRDDAGRATRGKPTHGAANSAGSLVTQQEETTP